MAKNSRWGRIWKERGKEERDGRRRRGGFGRPWPAVLEACWVREKTEKDLFHHFLFFLVACLAFSAELRERERGGITRRTRGNHILDFPYRKTRPHKSTPRHHICLSERNLYGSVSCPYKPSWCDQPINFCHRIKLSCIQSYHFFFPFISSIQQQCQCCTFFSSSTLLKIKINIIHKSKSKVA